EVLVARGALLAIPSLFVDEYNRSEQRKPLDGEGQVRQIGNRAMAVLEIECIEELLGALAADFLKRVAHGERRARVFGHGVSQHFGVCAMDGKDVGLVLGCLGGLIVGHGQQNTIVGSLENWTAAFIPIHK